MENGLLGLKKGGKTTSQEADGTVDRKRKVA